MMPIERSCDLCGAAYHAARSTARFCSTTCRMRNHRAEKAVTPEVTALRAWLVKRGFASKNRLSVSRKLASEELCRNVAAIKERGLRAVLPCYSDAAFKHALSSAGLK